MENRDRDKMNKNVNSTSSEDVNRSTSSKLDQSKGDSQSNFGKNSGRSEEISNEPSRRSGSVDSSGMKGKDSDLGSSSQSGIKDNSGSRH